MLLLSFLVLQASGQEGVSDSAYYPERFYVRLDLGLSSDAVTDRVKGLVEQVSPDARLLSCEDPIRLEAPSLKGIRELRFDKAPDPVPFIRSLEQHEEVLYAEQVPRYRFFYTPNDLQGTQWSLPKINAELAWDIEQGVDSIDIAVIDNAIRYSHEDLIGALDTNTAEVAGNGVDDDGNGYIDDRIGWDAANNDNDPSPPGWATNSQFTHGTHVAGVAAASTDNGKGMASLGFNVDYIPVKIAEDATGDLTAGLQGIQYAVAADAEVINMSWGGGGYSNTYQNLIDAAHDSGIVMVAAAGNSNTSTPHYPAAYQHVIGVGATDPNDQKASFSNYGSYIDVMAPGTDIYSALAGNDSAYGDLSGTSMASPLTAGLCGLMRSKSPFLPPDSIEACLKRTCVDISSQNPSYSGQLGAGRIDAKAALNCIPPILADFTSTRTWICPGDSVHFFDASQGGPTSWEWTFPGGTPNNSTKQNPWVEYPATDTYKVKLVVSNSKGADSVTYVDTIKVAYPTGNLSGSTTINVGASAYLQVSLTGNPPWSFTYTDGVDTFTVNNVTYEPYLLKVSPDTTTTYELLEVTSDGCTGSGSGTATVKVDSSGCNWTGDKFTRIIGGGGDDKAYSVLETSDTGIVVAGHTNSTGAGQRDLFLLKMDSLGNNEWGKTYGSSGDEYDHYRGINVTQTDDKGFLLTGTTDGFGANSHQFYVVRTDSVGDVKWEKRFGGGFSNSIPAQFEATHDGGFLIGGSSGEYGPGTSDYYLIKLDSNGTLLWTKAFGKGNVEHCNDLI